MFMVIHQNDMDSMSFIKHIKNKNVNFIDVSLDDLIKNTEIQSELNDGYYQTNWSIHAGALPKKIINLNDIIGIYNTTYYPERDYFLDFKQEDIEYARSEWNAYLLYQLSTHKNCLNPISHRQFVGTSLSLLNIYKICKKYGFSVPKYFLISNREKEFKHLNEEDFIFKTTTYDYTNYKTLKDSQKPIMAIKIQHGAQIVCYIVNNTIISKIKYSDNEYIYNMEKNIENKCFSLVNYLNLKVAEILFIKTKNGEYYLYHVSPYPNFNVLGKDKVIVWDELINALSKK